MNYLWGGMILIGIVYGAVTGNMQAVTDAAIASSKEAVTLGISMVGVVSLWTGLMEIAREGGLIEGLCQKLRPVISFLFPNLPKEHPAGEHIATNLIANILGLGWAATPAGLKAMEELSNLEKQRQKQGISTVRQGVASNEMCTFLIVNISSLQLIPVNVIAYRSQYGSMNPAAIVGAAMMATMVSTLVAVVYCKVMDRRGNRK